MRKSTAAPSALEIAGEDRPEGEVADDRQQGGGDAGGEVVDQHLEAGLDLAVPELVEVLHHAGGERAHDHRAEELGLLGADDHAHGGDDGHHAAAHAVDHPAALAGDQQRQHVPDHRADDADVLIALGVDTEAAEPGDRSPPLLDEEGGDQAPGDEGGNIRHDHAGKECAELLNRDAGAAGPAGASLYVCGHIYAFRDKGQVERARQQRHACTAAWRAAHRGLSIDRIPMVPPQQIFGRLARLCIGQALSVEWQCAARWLPTGQDGRQGTHDC